ncbi:MAG: DUF4340 domain-containing protein [Roseibacillus sp.]|nr:DUF4340 domain-containing protein [Roseibacillus sp.]
MQSRKLTVILILATCLVGGLASMQLARNDLGALLGAPSRRIGEELYHDFNIKKNEVHTVVITNSTGELAEFTKRKGVWLMQSPVRDRADYRNLQRIVYFSRHLKVEDIIRRQDTTLEEIGMRATEAHRGRFHITLKDSAGNSLADYRLGRRSAWHRLNEKEGTLTETFFVRPAKKSQKDNIYVCSAPDIINPSVRSILDRGFERLRDHHPFLFDKTALSDIIIKRGGGEIVLSRTKLNAPWRMSKPLESRTKPETMAGLILGLFELEAVQIHDRKSVTIPPGPPGLEIDLMRFGSTGARIPHRSKMTVMPPKTADADTVYATISTRPGLVFEIPYKPVRGRMALGQLPLTVDQLRSRTLASLDIRVLESITIHSLRQVDPIEIFLGSQQGNRRWMLSLRGEAAPANEVALGALLHGISNNEVLSFVSDAARDLGAFGLAPPQKRLLLRGKGNTSLDLLFGRGDDGKFYAMRRGSSTVAEIDSGTFTAIAAGHHDWRDTLLMPFSIVDLRIMKLEGPIRAPLADPALTLNYDFLDESWTARQFGEDVTAILDTQKANHFIKLMESLRVEKWLGETSPAAQRALLRPTFRFTALFQQISIEGVRIGMRESSFELAPASRSSRNRFYYGRLSGDPHYFVITTDAHREITTQLVDHGGSVIQAPTTK